MAINLDEAIQTALEFEKKVYRVYADAVDRIDDPVGKKVFKQLSLEEAQHVTYLQHRLEEWRKDGRIDIRELSTVVPDRERILDGKKRMAQSVEGRRPAASEIDYLKNAFEAEKQTAAFYRQMVSELSDEGRELFARFVEIEEGHVAIVQAEMDSVQGMGFWFDMQEFNLEAG
ncbi:MAG: ferritin family protein [Acidobacteria bacterium]|nr:ferritin family protein [Acidobacteriota bacterium]